MRRRLLLVAVAALAVASGAVALAPPTVRAEVSADASGPAGSGPAGGGPAGTAVTAVPVVGPIPSPTLVAAAPPTVSAPPPPPTGKVLYLSFDDGPDPSWTPRVLRILAVHHARATFFEVGKQIHDHPHTAALVRASGQSIGDHTLDHAHLLTLTDAQVLNQITAGPASSCLRPPYGEVDARVTRIAASAGRSIVLWTVDTEDWRQPGIATIQAHLVGDARPGAIVLMHDGGGTRSQTLRALDLGLTALAAQGWRFEAVPGC
jgi:peptidoglycan/xylan/chitin deacetylase (PgdA/CDA1 family)